MKKTVSFLVALTLMLSLCVGALAEKAQVEMWTLFTGDDGVALQTIVDDFNASQEAVEMTHIAIDRETLYTKLALAVQTPESCPDLFVTYTYDIPYFTSLNMIQPMDEALAAYKNFDFALDKYHASATGANTYDGKRYAVSLDFPTWGMYVNTAMAEKYCPDVLTDDILTFDEIKTVGESLKAQGIADVKVLASGWARNDLSNTYMQLANTWATADGKELAINKEAAAKSIDLWKECYDAGYLWQEGDDCAGLFALENAIFYTGGTWNMSAIKEYGFDFKFIPAPQISAEKVLVFGASHAFMMPTKTYSPEEIQAIDSFMAYFYSNSLAWANAGSIVASKEVLESTEFQALPQSYLSNHYNVVDVAYTYSSIVLDTLMSFDWQPLYGQMTAQEFAESWEKQTMERIAAQ